MNHRISSRRKAPVTSRSCHQLLLGQGRAEIRHQAPEFFILVKQKKWHWLAESEQGVSIQLYAALLLSRRLGKLPDKRTLELLRVHAHGMVRDTELDQPSIA